MAIVTYNVGTNPSNIFGIEVDTMTGTITSDGQLKGCSITETNIESSTDINCNNNDGISENYDVCNLDIVCP
jgi:hypothetical protein